MKKRTVILPTKFTAFLTESLSETRAMQNTNDIKLIIFYPIIVKIRVGRTKYVLTRAPY